MFKKNRAVKNPMEIKEIAGTWVSAFTDTDNTIKRLKKEKLSARDGLLSAGFISLLAGIVIFVAVAALISLVPSAAAVIGISGYVTLFATYVILLPLLAMLGVAVFTALLRGVSMLVGGKGGFSRDLGIVGILFGVLVVSMVPSEIVSIIAGLAGTGLLALLFGALSMLLYIGLLFFVFGIALEPLADAERLSVARFGMAFGFSLGIVVLIGALGAALFGATPSITTP